MRAYISVDATTCSGACSLFVITDSELQMPRHDTLPLVIARSIASQLEDLGSEVLRHRSKVDTVHTANRELEAGLGRARLRLAICARLVTR
ncbi:hypothetical protein BC834DRAFT_895154, partial [Gloeopeniophorella convolvens]